MTKKVMVLMGGFSSEKEVSIESGRGVAAALIKCGYEVVTHNLTDTRKFIAALNTEKPDVVFNALHGNWARTEPFRRFWIYYKFLIHIPVC